MGEQFLGQSDKVQSEISGRDGGPVRPARELTDTESLNSTRAREKAKDGTSTADPSLHL